MESMLLTLAAVVLVTIAAYAHHRLAFHIEGRGKTALARALLAGIGIGLGMMTAASYPGDAGRAVLAFIIGFGVVHVPAAFILFFKGARGEGKS